MMSQPFPLPFLLSSTFFTMVSKVLSSFYASSSSLQPLFIPALVISSVLTLWLVQPYHPPIPPFIIPSASHHPFISALIISSLLTMWLVQSYNPSGRPYLLSSFLQLLSSHHPFIPHSSHSTNPSSSLHKYSPHSCQIHSEHMLLSPRQLC